MAMSGSARAGDGFSLIELMVTLAVLGTLLLAVTPLVRDWMFDTEIRNAAESISTGLSKARAEAVRRNEPVLFSLVTNDNPGMLDNNCAVSSTSASWVVSLDDPAGHCAEALGTTTGTRLVARHARGDGAPGVTVEVRDARCQNATGQAQVLFNGFGRAQPAPAPIRCIVVRHPGSATTRTLHVVLNSGGTVRTCDPAATDPRDTRRCLVN
ncbi:GspH/FimT family pseudopilin [Sphaerotilus sp.]|uniref:GspH/FimT family pseudopilin n=1 Tax=Sphaerotilus sp. TaxID=2093942 RepID=UPI002ACD517D|nr:GspH/FimT family pseudopilin [Sphaerotilus sp.]MDZ7858458.1 GspH/FimT family pseudopilin [Sphaerotilus sp.]